MGIGRYEGGKGVFDTIYAESRVDEGEGGLCVLEGFCWWM